MFAVANFTLFCPLSLSIRSGFCFWDVSVGTRGTQQEGRGGQKYLVLPHCVQSAERDVEYQNDPEVEEVLSHQHSILVLHDPLQVDCTSLIWSSLYKCIILIGHFWTHFTDTNIVEH